MQAQSQAGEIARLILGFIPVIGDSANLLEQLYNRASGRGVDPVIAFLAGAGLALDVTTGGSGDITAGVKGVYRFSKSSAGFLAEVIRDSVVGLVGGRARPSAVLDSLRNQFQSVSDLFFREGWNGVVKSDRFGKALNNFPACDLGSENVTIQGCSSRLREAVLRDIASASKVAKTSAAKMVDELKKICCSVAEGGKGYIEGSGNLIKRARTANRAWLYDGILAEIKAADSLRDAGFTGMRIPARDEFRLPDGRTSEPDLIATDTINLVDGRPVKRVFEVKSRGPDLEQLPILVEIARQLGARPTFVSKGELTSVQILEIRRRGVDVLSLDGRLLR